MCWFAGFGLLFVKSGQDALIVLVAAGVPIGLILLFSPKPMFLLALCGGAFHVGLLMMLWAGRKDRPRRHK